MVLLRFVRPDSAASLEDWRQVHNVVIPPAPLSLAEVRERASRNHLEVAYLGVTPVGNSTVWPPTGRAGTARVIARVLPDYRRQGLGAAIHERALRKAEELGATSFGTVVLAVNTDGLRFATRHGYVETGRYVLPGGTDEWIELEATDRPAGPD
jgi:GNAT superfamily N-acetyltransferase